MATNKVNTTNEEDKKKKKKLFIIFGSILGAGAIAGTSVGIYFATKPNNNQVDVVFEEAVIGVALETNKATIGKDYDTKILVDTSKTSGKILKDTLDEVKSGNDILTKDTSYTYSIDGAKTTGTLHIPAEYVKGKVEIKVTLVTPQPDPPVGESWTAELDNTSQTYGKLSYKGKEDYSIDIEEYIGLKSATISFIPEAGYVDTQFTVTAQDTKGSTFDISYVPGTTASIAVTSDKEFVDDDKVTLHFEEPAPAETATLSLDENSKQYGKLKYGTQEAAYTVDISEEITHKSFTVDFVPGTTYTNIDFIINATGSSFKAKYNSSDKKITFDSSSALKAGDILVITLNIPWYEDKAYLNDLDESDVGKEIKTLRVNGVDHKVRLIGVDQDEDGNGDPIHTTWEFANLISDDLGYSLALQWNDIDALTVDYKIINYLNSTARKALNGNGDADHFLWSDTDIDWENPTWSKKYFTTVQDMLNKSNPGFINALTAPYKTVMCTDDGSTWSEEDIIDENGEYDKLFLLSPKEMGYDDGYQEEYSSTYLYYEGASDIMEPIRIKKQVNETEVSTERIKIPYDAESGQLFKNIVYSYAGYNYKTDETGGGYAISRAPCRINTSNPGIYYVTSTGKLTSDTKYYSSAYGIAPAFCI